MKLVSESKTEFMIQKTLSEGTEPSQFLLVISTQTEPAEPAGNLWYLIAELSPSKINKGKQILYWFVCEYT